ncbi:hypothetical protein [Sphingomonas abietis]|uniref:Uncharacterized protein n=1 Tax=Sphingomonas abietis TaxID=3012344 RepID=A0ABY7NPD2_9SPHN|nr:hypothetical protein [Sphingomonas abietis]WBO21336.1 hypothetical protein PBT88_14225 [Sphingomonas abietis]
MSSDHLAEVWGDIVDTRHLRASIAIGATISLLAYFGAIHLFSILGSDASVSKTYAMLVGLGGCLLSCAVCARLFPPKRILIESGHDEQARKEAVAAIMKSAEDRNESLPPAVVEELKALGLYDMLPLDEQEQGSQSSDGRRHGPTVREA